MMSSYIILTILGCGLLTWLPRVIPFILTKNMVFSKKTKQFLSYIPMCILTALCVQGFLVIEKGQLTTVNMQNLLAGIPTLIIAIMTKSLMWTVVSGIVTMGVLRYLFY